MQDILKKLNISELYTRPVKKPKKFDTVKANIPLIAGYNYMCDLLFLPTTKEGYKYLLVIVDLANDAFDMEPIKNKESATVLKAMQMIFKRGILTIPYASIRSDSGTEFHGVFHKWLYDKNILHTYALPNRHSQVANVERLNRELGRLYNGYLNHMKEETGEVYREWTDVTDIIRTELNAFRLKKLPKDITKVKYAAPKIQLNPKFKVGDIVYRQLDAPQNILGAEQNTKQFREGDRRWDLVPRKIKQEFIYNLGPRYILTGIPNVSYTESQLMKAKNEKEEKYIVEKLVKKVMKNKKVYFEVKWRGYNSSENTLESRDQLIKDIPLLVAKFEKK